MATASGTGCHWKIRVSNLAEIGMGKSHFCRYVADPGVRLPSNNLSIGEDDVRRRMKNKCRFASNRRLTIHSVQPIFA